MAKKKPLEAYWDRASLALRKQVAKDAGTNYRWLYQIAKEHHLCSAALAKKIELATGGIVTRAEIRPDIFG